MMIKNTEFENLINTLPVRIHKQKKIECYCGAEHEKLVTYKLQLNIDRSYGLNGHFRPQYNLYYKCSDFSIGNPNRYIGNIGGLGFCTFKDAYDDLLRYLKQEGIELEVNNG